MWVGESEAATARLIPLPELQALLEPLARREGLLLSFADGAAEDGTTVLTPGETGLPFLLRVSASDDWANGLDFGSARTLLIAGLGSTFALMLAAAYLLYRVTTREVALAQQQADFV